MNFFGEGIWASIIEEEIFYLSLKVSTEFRYAKIEEEVNKLMDES